MDPIAHRPHLMMRRERRLPSSIKVTVRAVRYDLLSLEADMRRREFFSILGGAAVAWPLAAQAQQPDRTRRIAVLMPYGEGEISDSIRRAFEQALRDLSWINGRNIQIEYRLAGERFWAAAQFGERGGQAPSRRHRSS